MKNPEKLKAWIFIFIVRFSGKREWENYRTDARRVVSEAKMGDVSLGVGIVGCKEENENGSPQRGLERSLHGSEMTLPRRIESPDGVFFSFF